MIGAGVFVIGVISIFIIFKFGKKPVTTPPVQEQVTINQTNDQVNVKVGTEPTVVPKNVKITPPTAIQQEDITVKNIARVYIERYHTYSSENNFQNIRDIESIVTAAYWKKISAPMVAKIAPPASFVSLTTEVLSILSVDVKSISASVALNTRQTAIANGQTTVSFKEYTVTLVKSGGSWLVSGETAK
jgi:hypothetical protein